MKKYLILTFSLLFVQCSTAFEQGKTFDWNSKKVKHLCPAVCYTTFEFKSPRLLKAAAVKIDLSDPAIAFQMTPRAKKWGEKMTNFPRYTIRTERKTCRQFMNESIENGKNMLVCVNASPWSPWQAPWNHPFADRLGLIIDNGTLVSPPLPRRAFFYVDTNGTCGFDVNRKDMDVSRYKHAVSGFNQVLKNKKVLKSSNKKLAPRTGYGLSEDRKTMYIIVIDGRQPKYSQGVSRQEVGKLLLFLGAADGLNMDGGGSTTLLIREKGEVKKLNRYILGRERAVGGAMGILYRK